MQTSLRGDTESKMLCYWHVCDKFLQKQVQNGEVGGWQKESLANKMPWFSESGSRTQRAEIASSQQNSQEATLGKFKPSD